MRNHVHGNDDSSLRCDDVVCNLSCNFTCDLMQKLPIKLQTSLRRFLSDLCRGSTYVAAPCDLFPFKQNNVRGNDVYLK